MDTMETWCAAEYRYGFEPMTPVPRMRVADLKWKNRRHFLNLMEKHSFVVLTDLGSGMKKYAELLSELKEFFCHTSPEAKQQCISKHIYRNEKNTPMWYCGYETTSVRDCFRVAAGDLSKCIWPSETFKSAWIQLLTYLQKICDKCLSLTEGYTIAPASARPDRYFSVCYGLYYPNTLGTGQSEQENVYEHVDPSLYVIEPICDVEGLDVFDQWSQEWISAETIGIGGKELVVFGGKALERLTGSKIKGTLHRVRRSESERMCFIYEQKYADYY